ncbi:hypothetical protein KI387_002127 [Taxus chinensis]|uniref:protein-serine/threonine phosphatase n=1 Tax=Taxus chinensis TaxID=29808 RepID=A0AA38LN60_TAXCH|nr:hypothetical protein KI387_002127 [Taxus chinensis]
MKMKMALTTAAVQVASSSPLGRAPSRFSPSSMKTRSFQDLSIEISSQPLVSPSGRFSGLSHRRPSPTAINLNCHGLAQRNDKSPATYDNPKSSILIQEENQRLNDSERGVITAFVDESKRPRRQRPPNLVIPQTSTSVAPFVKLEEELHKEMYGQGRNYSVACKKGRREVMEDAFRATTDISGNSTTAFFGVFDGHGGRMAADFAAERLGQYIVDELGQGEGDLEKAVRTAYLTTDEAFSKKKISSGACCVTTLIRDGRMVVANAGDCRAVLSRNGIAEALTCDHRLEREDERQRIQDLGGYVDCHNGVWRAQGVLAVSRSIGDIHMKEWLSAEPEMKKLNITSDCEFLILASDGLWDKVSNEEAVAIARPFCVEKEETTTRLCERSLMAACRKLVEVAVSRGSKDDVTVMIADLVNFSS